MYTAIQETSTSCHIIHTIIFHFTNWERLMVNFRYFLLYQYAFLGISNWTPWKMLVPLPNELVSPEINHWTTLSSKFRNKKKHKKRCLHFFRQLGLGDERIQASSTEDI